MRILYHNRCNTYRNNDYKTFENNKQISTANNAKVKKYCRSKYITIKNKRYRYPSTMLQIDVVCDTCGKVNRFILFFNIYLPSALVMLLNVSTIQKYAAATSGCDLHPG